MNIPHNVEYLEMYDCDYDPENKSIVEFLRYVNPRGGTLLDYACGGALMVAAALEKNFDEIHCGDIDQDFIEQIALFKRGAGFNWTPLFHQMKYKRADILRSKLSYLLLSRFPYEPLRRYDTITTFFSLEFAAKTHQEFKAYYKTLREGVRAGGWLVSGFVLGNDEVVPSLPLDSSPLTLSDEFILRTIKPAIFHKIDACAPRGYKGMVFCAERC